MIDESSTLEDICYAVGDALERGNIEAVLTGGSAATMFVPESYQSGDADFILTFSSDDAPAGVILQGLGFARSGRSYAHPSSIYTVEFPMGPLGIGDDIITSHATLRRGDETLRVLTPTDSARDRLASFYYWNDFSALAVATAIGKAHPVDIDAIEAWSHREAVRHGGYRQIDKFDTFRRSIALR